MECADADCLVRCNGGACVAKDCDLEGDSCVVLCGEYDTVGDVVQDGDDARCR